MFLPRAWTIHLAEESPIADGNEHIIAKLATRGDDETESSPILIWAQHTGSEAVALVYSRCIRGYWSSPQQISTDESGELAERWWHGSLLTFVHHNPEEARAHDQTQTEMIDISNASDQNGRPAHAWTIFVDNSILVLPSTWMSRDGEPTLGVTRIGDMVVPTVTWAHGVSAGNHDPVIARFINGAWTAAQSIASSPLNDRDPRIAQDAAQQVHAVWGRDAADGSFDEEIFYANLPEGSGAFSSEKRISRSGESAFNPSLAVLPSGEAFVAYESERGDAAPCVIVARRVERRGAEGYFFRHRAAGRTSDEVPASPELSVLGDDSLLLTWIVSPTRVGYRVLSHGRWSAVGHEPIGSTETQVQARGRVAPALQDR